MRLEWSTEDLVGSWTLVDDDWRLVGNKTGATRLGFALLLKFFELEARFPSTAAEVPPPAVSYVARQVSVDPDLFALYAWSGRAIERHRVQIRHAFGFRAFSRGDEDKLADWLATEVCPVELRDEQLQEALLVRCRAERLEPPGRADRIIGSARTRFERQFCDLILSRLPDDCAQRLEALVDAGSGRGEPALPVADAVGGVARAAGLHVVAGGDLPDDHAADHGVADDRVPQGAATRHRGAGR